MTSTKNRTLYSYVLCKARSSMTLSVAKIIQRQCSVIWSTGGMMLTEEFRISLRKPCRSATSSTMNSTRTVMGLNPGLHGRRPATNRLSYGTALMVRKNKYFY